MERERELILRVGVCGEESERDGANAGAGASLKVLLPLPLQLLRLPSVVR